MKRRILNFGHFLLENTKPTVINEDLNISAIPSSELQAIIDTDMKTYLKKAMWNKSIEVFYGKDYKGNPTEDKREVYVGDWFESHDITTMGEFFQDAWKETDQFCDRVVELVETGEISDIWGSIGKGAIWAGVGLATVAAIIGTGGMALGALGVATAAGTTMTAGAAVLSGFGIGATTIGGAAGVALYVDDIMDEEKIKNLSPQVVNLLDMIKDKEGTIKNFKSAIEGYKSDFEADWGLDRWLPAIQGMPGWSKSSWSKSSAENIGYSFSYWISYYAYQFLKIKFGASVVIAAKESDEKKTSAPAVSPAPAPAPAQTSKPSETTKKIQTTTETPSGVMGSAKAKEYNIVVDDSTVANYDL